MTKVITYGTYDLLHYGHINLLKRAKALGDYLIVGVTADDYDKTRGKINVQQPLVERIEAVRATGLADEIIVEEYEGQKIDDIKRFDIDIFTVGSDWKGKFNYLSDYCKVVYLDRTEGISSSEIRAEKCEVRLGLVGNEASIITKFYNECQYVNGIKVVGVATGSPDRFGAEIKNLPLVTDNFDTLLEAVDAVYIISHPSRHFEQVEKALKRGRHVLCESPIALSKEQCDYLFDLAEKQHLILVDGIKTAYSTAYFRLLMLVMSSKIGSVVSVDATCTSLKDFTKVNIENSWNSLCGWGPTALLPIFQILGCDYTSCNIISKTLDKEGKFDIFTKIDFVYPGAVASLKVGSGVKSEGELIISGTKGYVYVPAPWWKTDYFEVRYENPANNKRYFYQLDGEGIRYEIVAFVRAIQSGKKPSYIDKKVSLAIANIIETFMKKEFVAI